MADFTMNPKADPSDGYPPEGFEYIPFVPGISLPPQGPLTDFQPAPDRAACEALWDRYAVPAHIREHCQGVAHILEVLGALIIKRGARLDPVMLLAGGLLHDIAKMYTVNYPGDHAQMGAAIVLRETRHYRLAQMVYHHVEWPWRADIDNDAILPILMLIYADKRVTHNKIVTLDERFTDLFARYGHTERRRLMIERSRQQGLEIEKALSERLEVRLDEYSFDSGRLV